jgi:hypothetical protein
MVTATPAEFGHDCAPYAEQPRKVGRYENAGSTMAGASTESERNGEGFGASNVARYCHASQRGCASLRRSADPVESRRRCQAIFGSFQDRPPVRGTGRHRRPLPLCLHAGAQYNSARSDLRHTEGGPRLSCRPVGRSVRTRVRSSRTDACDRGELSGIGSLLDHAAWGPLAQGYPAARPRTQGIVSGLQVVGFERMRGPAHARRRTSNSRNIRVSPHERSRTRRTLRSYHPIWMRPQHPQVVFLSAA